MCLEEGHMPGDPKQCRRYAARCLALAQRTRNPDTRQNFALMAETWEKLAAEIESDQALFAVLHEMELGEPSYTLPLALGPSVSQTLVKEQPLAFDVAP